MHFARLVEQASATGFSRPIGLSQTWSITDLVATYLSLELTFIAFTFAQLSWCKPGFTDYNVNLTEHHCD